jgi:hypothetical protein
VAWLPLAARAAAQLLRAAQPSASNLVGDPFACNGIDPLPAMGSLLAACGSCMIELGCLASGLSHRTRPRSQQAAGR